MLCCPYCSMSSAILFSIVTPDRGLDSGSTTCSVLLTTLNNVGSTTLFNAVFIRPEQVVRFLLCITQLLLQYYGSTRTLAMNF